MYIKLKPNDLLEIEMPNQPIMIIYVGSENSQVTWNTTRARPIEIRKDVETLSGDENIDEVILRRSKELHEQFEAENLRIDNENSFDFFNAVEDVLAPKRKKKVQTDADAPVSRMPRKGRWPKIGQTLLFEGKSENDWKIALIDGIALQQDKIGTGKYKRTTLLTFGSHANKGMIVPVSKLKWDYKQVAWIGSWHDVRARHPDVLDKPREGWKAARQFRAAHKRK